MMTEHPNRLRKGPWGQGLPGGFISHGGFNVVDVLQALQGVFEQVHQAVEHGSRVLGEGGVFAAFTCLLCQFGQAGCTRCMTYELLLRLFFIVNRFPFAPKIMAGLLIFILRV